MTDFQQYYAVADTINIREITSRELNARLLRRVKCSHKGLTDLSVNYWDETGGNFDPDSAEELKWLGYFIGLNTRLKKLSISGGDFHNEDADVSTEDMEFFCDCLKRNISIECLDVGNMTADEDGTFRLEMFRPFLQNTPRLSQLILLGCHLSAETASLLSLAKTVKHIELERVEMDDEALGEACQRRFSFLLWIILFCMKSMQGGTHAQKLRAFCTRLPQS